MANWREKNVLVIANFDLRIPGNPRNKFPRQHGAGIRNINPAARACLLGIALLGTSFPALASEDPVKDEKPSLPLTLRVYDYEGLRPLVLQRAIEHVNFILASSRVSVTPIYCTRNTRLAVCSHPPDALNINLRIVPTAIPDVSEHTLGYALGFMLTVNYRRLERVSEQLDIPADRMLACVVAHELGHVLLGPNAHSASGIMRDTWGDDELAQIREMLIGFLPVQRNRIRAYVLSHVLNARTSSAAFTTRTAAWSPRASP